MESTVDFTLAPEYFPSLGDIIPDGKSAISPFKGLATGDATPVTRELMLGAGIMDSDGNIRPDVQKALGVLASSESYTRIYLSEGAALFEQAIYHDPQGGEPVSITTVEQGLRVQYPFAVDELLEALRQNLGESVIADIDFAAEFKKEEAVVIAGVVDLYRKRVLAALVSDAEADTSPLTPESILQSVRNEKGGPQWLSVIVRGMFKDTVNLELDSIRNSLEALAASGHMVREQGGFSAGEKLQFLSGRMLILDRILHVEAGRATSSGGVFYVGFSCLQTGVHDLLYLEKNGDFLALEGMSSAGVIDLAGQFLNNPEALEEVAERETEAEMATADTEGTVLYSQESEGAVLAITGGPGPNGTHEIRDGCTVGRDASADLVIADPRISRRHALFGRDLNGLWTVKDLGSSNGTFVNDEQVDSKALSDGDTVRIGDTTLQFSQK